MSIFGKLFGRKLTQAERWAIATGANLAATQGDTFSRLAMDVPREAAQESLRDWWEIRGKRQELSDNYLYARRWWGGEDEAEQVFANAAKRLLTHPKSPWHDLPWLTPLS